MRPAFIYAPTYKSGAKLDFYLQVVRLEWYDYAVDMLLDGLSPKKIREQLDEHIRDRLQKGGYGERGEQTYTKAITQIMKCWVSPDKDVKAFRDHALVYAKNNQRDIRIALHWAMTISAYPFWYKVAEQTGRLLMLQQTVTQRQIRQRCFESMGERSTVERSARRVIRSFVTWGVLKDFASKGCYEKPDPIHIPGQNLGVLLIEATIHAIPEGKAPLNMLLNTPSLFPFQLPTMTGDFISQHSDCVEVVRYGLDDELLKFKV